MKRKLCSVLLALCMVLTLLPVSAMAEDGTATSLPDADENGVITLTENVELTNGLNYTKDVTIVLNGHTITRTNGQKTALMITNGATMTIDGSVAGSAINGTIVVGYSTPSVTNGKLIINGGTYTATVTDDCVVQTNGLCDNCEITATNATFNSTDDTFYLAGNGTYRLENCEINGYTGIYMKSGSLTLNNTTIKATGTYADPVANGNGASSTGDGIILDAKTGYKGNINLNINGGSISSNNAYAIRETYTDSTATATHSITVNGGTYTSSKDAINVSEYFKKAVASGVSSISISGGTFSDLSALDYLASGASVTVKLAENTTKDVTIPAGATVTLDLNGKTLTNVSGHTITNNGNLTVTGNGTVDNITNGKGALVNKVGAIATLNGGTFTRSQEAGTYEPDLANGNSWYTVKNYGTMTINAGATVTTRLTDDNGNAVGGHSSLIANGWQNANDLTNNPRNDKQNALLTVNGGTFIGGINTVKNDDYSELVFNNGTCTNYTQAAFQNHNIATINGGSFVAESHWSIYNCPCDANSDKGELTITGGSSTGNIAHVKADYGFIKISGGTYSVNPTAYVADTHIARKDGDAQYTVVAKSNLTSGVYTSDPSSALAPGYVSYKNSDNTYTVYYPVPVTPGNTSSSTTKNPDGSTTTTTTDKTTGTVTETTKNPDGSTTTVETKKDGSVTETNKTANGSVGTVKTDANGNSEISASISAADVSAAAKKNEPVAAPVSVAPAASPAAAPVIKLSVPASAGEVSVVIPVTNAQQGTVAIKVNPDGTEEIIKTSVVTKDGVVLGVKGSAQIKIVNNDKDFSDTVGHWAESDVDFVSARELFTGTAPQTFSPESATTRGMVVTVLARLAGESTDGGANWYDKGCAWAVTNGVSDGTDPNGTVTREQLAAMLYRYFGSPAVSGSLSFADASSVSEYAHDAMQWCVNNGIINGMDGLLNPQGQATRAQVSAMFARYIRLMSTK